MKCPNVARECSEPQRGVNSAKNHFFLQSDSLEM